MRRVVVTEEWDRIYRLHARTPGYRHRVRRAREIILRAWEIAERRAVSVSWGKDSMVVLHLVRQVDPNVLVFHFDTHCNLPEAEALRDRVVPEWELNYVEYRSSVSALELYAKYGWTPRPVMSKLPEGDLITKFIEEHTIELQFLGLRKEESKGREVSLVSRGPVYFSQRDGVWMCCPLSDWSGRDVMAYIVEHNVPLSDVYRKLKFVEEPSEVRTGWYCGPSSHAAADRRFAWLRYYHPDLWQRLVEAIPEAAQYA